MAEKLRTNFKIGDILSPEDVNRTNATINANLDSIKATEDAAAYAATSALSAAQAAGDASGYLANLQGAIQELPDGQAVSAQVAENTVEIDRVPQRIIGATSYANVYEVEQSYIKNGVKTNVEGAYSAVVKAEINKTYKIEASGNNRFALHGLKNGEYTEIVSNHSLHEYVYINTQYETLRLFYYYRTTNEFSGTINFYQYYGSNMPSKFAVNGVPMPTYDDMDLVTGRVASVEGSVEEAMVEIGKVPSQIIGATSYADMYEIKNEYISNGHRTTNTLAKSALVNAEIGKTYQIKVAGNNRFSLYGGVEGEYTQIVSDNMLDEYTYTNELYDTLILFHYYGETYNCEVHVYQYYGSAMPTQFEVNGVKAATQEFVNEVNSNVQAVQSFEYSDDIEVTEGEGFSVRAFPSLNIKAGQKFYFRLTQPSPRLVAYGSLIMSDGTSITITDNRDYEVTAENDISYINVYYSSGNVEGSGTITVDLKTEGYAEAEAKKQSAILEQSINELNNSVRELNIVNGLAAVYPTTIVAAHRTLIAEGINIAKGTKVQIKLAISEPAETNIHVYIGDIEGDAIKDMAILQGSTEGRMVYQYAPKEDIVNADLYYYSTRNSGDTLTVYMSYPATDAELEAKIDTTTSNLEDEISRAQQQEADLSQRITELAETVDNINPTSISGDVTNAADEEDLTADPTTQLIKFKNRAKGTSYGYKILRQGVTIASQMNAIDDTNTIFEVRYAFDLGGATLALPANSILYFNGGKITNGTITGNDSKIVAPYNSGIFATITIGGTWKQRNIYSEWFDFAKNSGIDDRGNFANLTALSNGVDYSDIYIASGDYYLSVTESGGYGILLKSNTGLHIDGTLHQRACAFRTFSFISVRQVSNVLIEGGTLIGDLETHEAQGQNTDAGAGIKIASSTNVTVRNITSNYFWGDGIDIVDVYRTKVDNENVFIDNVICHYNGRQGISIESGHNVRITNCDLSYTGQGENIIDPNRKCAPAGPWAGIDFEPYGISTDLSFYADHQKLKNIYVQNCRLYSNDGGAMAIIANYWRQGEHADDGVFNNIHIDNNITDGYICVGKSNGVFFKDNQIDFDYANFDHNKHLNYTIVEDIAINLDTSYNIHRSVGTKISKL